VGVPTTVDRKASKSNMVDAECEIYLHIQHKNEVKIHIKTKEQQILLVRHQLQRRATRWFQYNQKLKQTHSAYTKSKLGHRQR